MDLMRGHNEGSLFQRKTGPSKGQWVALVAMRDGRRVSRYAKDREGAKAELAELLRLRDVGAPLTGRIRLSAYLERWLSDGTHRMAPATRRKHESIVRVHLVPALGGIRLSELSVHDVDAYLVEARRRVGPQSVRHHRSTLRRALSDAVREGLAARNVGQLSAASPVAARERTILDAAGARRLIETTRDTPYGPLWTILVTTGLRISEALGLAWSDVELGGNDAAVSGRSVSMGGLSGTRRDDHELAERGHGGPLRRSLPSGARITGPSITVRRQLARENGEWVHRPPKTAKGRRTIPLTALGVSALQTRRAAQARDMGTRPQPIDGLVFTTSRGQPLHETNTLKALGTALAAAGLPRVTQHDLRHSCATLLYSMAVPLETIADILGHSSSRITGDLYRHRVPELQSEAALRMQEALG